MSDYRIVSGVVSTEEFGELERVRRELNIPRSELIRRAIVQFIAVHDYKMFVAALDREQWVQILDELRNYIYSSNPDKKAVITQIEKSSQGGQSFSSSTDAGESARPREKAPATIGRGSG